MKAQLDTKFLERFKALAEQLKGSVTLTSNRVLVEAIDDSQEEIKTESGIIIAKAPQGYAKSLTQSQKAHMAVVIMTGEDNKLPDSEQVVKPGDIVLISEYGVRPYSTFPGIMSYTEGAIQLTTTSEIHMIFSGIETFNEAIKVLNK